MKPKITILHGEKQGTKLSLEPDAPATLGRDKKADMPLEERKISRRHATITWDSKQGKVRIEDLNSLNGTQVNSETIKGPRELKPGDKIQVGSFLLEFQWSASEDISALPLEDQVEPAGENTNPDQDEELPQNQNHSSAQAQEEFLNNLIEDQPLDETGGRLIMGRLEELSLPDVLQMLAATKKTGQFVVSREKHTHPPKEAGENDAFIYLKQGTLLQVAFDSLENEEAFYQLLKFQKGYFALFPLPKDYTEPEQTMDTPLEVLLLEGMKYLDEQKEDEKNLSPEARLEPQPDQPLTSLSSEELQVFQIAWKYQTVQTILETSPFSEDHTKDLLKRLMRNEFLRKAD